jgi:hypothetical protein
VLCPSGRVVILLFLLLNSLERPRELIGAQVVDVVVKNNPLLSFLIYYHWLSRPRGFSREPFPATGLVLAGGSASKILLLSQL